jgi:hypothetical protein
LNGFNNQSSYQWTIAASSAGVLNFNGSAFAIDSSSFANDLAGGSFSVAVAGNALVLRFTPAMPPTLTNSGLLGNGTFNLSGTGGPNQFYVLLAAPDLTLPVGWAPVATNAADNDGVFNFTDQQATNYQQRYYHIRMGQ